jgi:O-antigen/teichoic acid export membrane protein
VPASISSSLFAEGCHDEGELFANVWRSLTLALGILAPLTLVLLAFAGPVLKIFGAEYAAQSTGLLRVLALAVPPMTINQIYFSVLRVEHRLRELTILNAVIAALTLGATYPLLSASGALGAGYGWLGGQTLVAIWITFGQGRWRKIVRRMLPWSRSRVQA